MPVLSLPAVSLPPVSLPPVSLPAPPELESAAPVDSPVDPLLVLSPPPLDSAPPDRADEIAAGLHALALTTLTPEEAAKQS